MLTHLQLFDFSDQEEPPRVVHSGSSVVYELNWRRLNRSVYLCYSLFLSLSVNEILRRLSASPLKIVSDINRYHTN